MFNRLLYIMQKVGDLFTRKDNGPRDLLFIENFNQSMVFYSNVIVGKIRNISHFFSIIVIAIRELLKFADILINKFLAFKIDCRHWNLFIDQEATSWIFLSHFCWFTNYVDRTQTDTTIVCKRVSAPPFKRGPHFFNRYPLLSIMIKSLFWLCLPPTFNTFKDFGPSPLLNPVQT